MEKSPFQILKKKGLNCKRNKILTERINWQWAKLLMQMLCFRISVLTLSAAPLQTVSLIFKVVLVAQTASVLEELAVHWGGVVEVTVVYPKTRSCVWFRFTGLYVGEWGREVTQGRGGHPSESGSPPLKTIMKMNALYLDVSACADLPVPLKRDVSSPEPSWSAGAKESTTCLLSRCITWQTQLEMQKPTTPQRFPFEEKLRKMRTCWLHTACPV